MDKVNNKKPEGFNRIQNEYQTLFEESPCYITVQDRDLKLLRYNREFEKIFAPEPGDYCFKAYKGRSERCPDCPVVKTFEDGQPHMSEEQAVTKDGIRTYWLVKTSPVKNAQGEVIAAMEMSLDLTHIKYLEKRAANSEERYKIIFNTISDPIFVLDAKDFTILDCNNSVTTVYGYTKEDLRNASFLSLFPAADRNAKAEALRTHPRIDTAKQIRKDGQTIFVNIGISASEYSGQAVYLVTTSDVTGQLMAQQQLIQASKMATLGEMATGVAHELNQPLSVIKTASSFLRRKADKREEINADILRTMAEEIDNHVDRASKIIGHMREFGRKSDVVKEKVQINDVLKRAVDFFKQQLKLREIEVVEDLDKDLPLVLADPNRLEQVFVNLLINARDAIEKKCETGGPKKGPKRITLNTKTEGAMVTIEVADTGTGIPEALLHRIFEPFFTTKKVGKGTGLGLSISYGIVQDYDGTIKVKNKEGEGATFVIGFPRVREA
jgi:histidine kinase